MTAGRLHPGHLILAALALAAALLAFRAIAVAIAPLPAPPPFAPPALADRALLGRVDPFFPAASAMSGDALPVTALPFSLHGVRADSATGRGSAFIATGDGQQQVYAVGDTLTDGVTLVAIAADHVVLDRGGTREALWLDSGGTEGVQRFDPAAAAGAQAGMPPFAAGASSGRQGGQGDEPDAFDPPPPPVEPETGRQAGPGPGPDGGPGSGTGGDR